MDNDDFTTDSLDISDCGLEFVDDSDQFHHKIMVMGLGGCGNNAINYMVRSGLKGPVFIGANSDLQALNPCLAARKVQLGVKTAAGHGCGGNPVIGRKCAEENLDEILKTLEDSDMVFLMAGLGGGTGSGAIPVVAQALTKLDSQPLVVGVVTRPFPWEDYREPLADEVITELRRYCNSVIIIPNARLCELDPDLPFMQAKALVDDILYRAVCSITELIENSGEINVDFADVCKIMTKKGSAIMGFGEASGEKRAQRALEMAITNPLMSETSLKGAKGVLVNITGDRSTPNGEVQAINKLVHREIGQGVEFICGFVVDDSLKDTNTLKVTVVATGLDQEEAEDEAAFSQSDARNGAEINMQVPVEIDSAWPRSAENAGSGHLAPVSQAPQAHVQGRGQGSVQGQAQGRAAQTYAESQTSVRRPVLLSPGETRTPAAPKDPAAAMVIRSGSHRQQTRYEYNQGVDPAFTQSEFFDLPPIYRDRKNKDRKDRDPLV
ncbi:MAG: cell division protein FtsZ [Deltaproteobacteria bacterium]|jgi:cell division protein FtsZ|nr:cell division protein FtsZ [Deltaproteobacteria bacterium]